MSNRLFQGVIHQMKDAIDRTVGVVDETGTIISCSELGRIGEVQESSLSDVFTGGEVTTIDSFTYRAFGTHMHPEYAVFVEGTDDIARRYVDIIAVALSSIKQYYDEKYDRSNFIKNVILDNILPGDIYLKSRELRFNNDATRVVLLIRILEHNDVSIYDVIQNLFPDKTKDFVININETDIALVKEVRANIEPKDLEKLARSIADSLGTEFYTHALVGIGTTVSGIKELARSFKEAQVALEVGKVFDTEKTIVSYDNLGIARLIYQLRQRCAICSCARCSSAVRLRISIRKRCLPSSASLRTTSMFPKHPASCSCIATHWSTAWKRLRNSQALTCASLMMRSSLKWL